MARHHTRLAMNKLRLAKLERVAAGTLILLDTTTAKRALELLRWWADFAPDLEVATTPYADVLEQRRRSRECAADISAAIGRREH